MISLTAYKPLFLVYVALFSFSLFAFVLAITSIDRQVRPTQFSVHLPRRSIAVFLFAVGPTQDLEMLGDRRWTDRKMLVDVSRSEFVATGKDF